jgi:hypothetical protein
METSSCMNQPKLIDLRFDRVFKSTPDRGIWDAKHHTREQDIEEFRVNAQNINYPVYRFGRFPKLDLYDCNFEIQRMTFFNIRNDTTIKSDSYYLYFEQAYAWFAARNEQHAKEIADVLRPFMDMLDSNERTYIIQDPLTLTITHFATRKIHDA